MTQPEAAKKLRTAVKEILVAGPDTAGLYRIERIKRGGQREAILVGLTYEEATALEGLSQAFDAMLAHHLGEPCA